MVLEGPPVTPAHTLALPAAPCAVCTPAPAAEPTLALSRAEADCRFLEYEPRQFSEMIEQVVDELIADGTWSVSCDQQRRIARSFAWITGDKPLGAYTHLDVNVFKEGLRRLPRTFRFGSPTKGAMSRPFAEVAAELPLVQPAERRENKTINRDLSFMSKRRHSPLFAGCPTAVVRSDSAAQLSSAAK